ncbi:MAG: protein kinase, partial [Bdellovibrionales bacterium]|nr:protein kinase [Bdellovibrionales bacterium]
TPNLDLKIADFGIAVIGDHVTCGEDDVMVGTLNYLSPEYIEKGIYDMRSDIYSLGIIAFELLTGKLPFSGKSPLENLMQRVKDKPLRPEYIRNDCPFDLSNIILKALHKDPEKRFQTAADFAEAIMQTESFEEYVRSGYDAPHSYQPTALS